MVLHNGAVNVPTVTGTLTGTHGVTVDWDSTVSLSADTQVFRFGSSDIMNGSKDRISIADSWSSQFELVYGTTTDDEYQAVLKAVGSTTAEE